MAVKNPYSKYNNNKVFSASKEDLTLMLYDGALKFCNQGIIALETSDNIKANACIIRVQNIIREFQLTLDRKYEISAELDRLYDYIYRRLIEANLKKDLEILTEVRDFIRSLRDTWKKSMLLARKGQ